MHPASSAFRLYIAALLSGVLLVLTVHAAPPKWMLEAEARPIPDEFSEADAILLHDERITTVQPNGRKKTKVMRAVKMLSRYGKTHTNAIIYYSKDSERISGFRAWLRPPEGKVKEYGSRDAIDIALSRSALYSDSRAISILPENVILNSVFAYEYTIEDRGTIGDELRYFQSNIPILLARSIYKLPQGWAIRSITFNRETPIEPVVSGQDYTWELKNIPKIKEEPSAPPSKNIAAQIGITLVPPRSGSKAPRLFFDTWAAIADYYYDIYMRASVPNDSITHKTQQLLSEAGPSKWDQIRAITRYMQSVTYVSIELGIGHGGGYVPQEAPKIFKNNYGDCKDQSCLLLAMLQAAGIKAYPVSAYLDYRHNVHPEWPSKKQFNHIIVAISVDDSVDSPAIIEHPKLGRLLLFDPTATNTPAGYIPANIQGSLIHILFPESEKLSLAPLAAPQVNHVSRNIEAKVTARGGLHALIDEKSFGRYAIVERSVRRRNDAEYEKYIRRWIHVTAPQSKILKTDTEDSIDTNTFVINTEFTVSNYARTMQDKLLVFKPALVDRKHVIPIDSNERTHLLLLKPSSFSESTTFEIPEGFSVDELPPPVDIESSFGRYTANTSIEDNLIKYQRSHILSASEVQPEDYARYRDYHIAIRKAEQTPVVLIRK